MTPALLNQHGIDTEDELTQQSYFVEPINEIYVSGLGKSLPSSNATMKSDQKARYNVMMLNLYKKNPPHDITLSLKTFLNGTEPECPPSCPHKVLY
jgi:hypothetical protein